MDVVTLGASKEQKKPGNDGSTTTTTIHEIATFQRAVFKITFENWPNEFNPPDQKNDWGLRDNQVSSSRITSALKHHLQY